MVELFKIGFISISLLDLLDVAIVAAITLWVYKALKDTIAVQILFGLIILTILSFTTEAINLKSMNWILKTIKDIWLLAFIILFQPELRRLLLRITRSQLFTIFTKSKINEALSEVVSAAVELSEKHIGALIVFTRSQNVQMTIETGIPMQAIVSKELIISIFNTKSPLHDGAVIIDEDTIISARCVLPLSNITKYEGRNLGTRHRAGLGLSEQIDVVVLIVSEETGSISVAESGQLILNIQKDRLNIVLNDFLSSKQK
ncbi:MAG: TIGR00159 family protein [Ignavibacteria bacterium]|nr:TIGR00159 family protein [Ignavibacteria bacterium]